MAEILCDRPLLARLRRTATEVLGGDGADDALQMVWLKLLQRRPELSNRDGVRRYLFAMVRGTALDLRRSRPLEGPPAALDGACTEEIGPVDAAVAADLLRCLEPLASAFIATPPKTRQRRTLYRQILQVLLDHGVVDLRLHELMKRHRPDQPARGRPMGGPVT